MSAPMLYGHIETIEERVEHLLKLRTLQDETGGFQTFICFPFLPKNTELEDSIAQTSMHGWRSGVTRADASRQVFWTFREAGVKRIISEGGVGTVNHLLDPRDFMIV